MKAAIYDRTSQRLFSIALALLFTLLLTTAATKPLAMRVITLTVVIFLLVLAVAATISRSRYDRQLEQEREGEVP